MKQFFTSLAENSEQVALAFWFLFIAMLGAVVKYLMKLRADAKMKFSLSALVGELFIAGFSGLITLLICREFGISDNVTSVLCGMSGFVGGKYLEMCEFAVTAQIEKFLARWTPIQKKEKE